MLHTERRLHHWWCSRPPGPENPGKHTWPQLPQPLSPTGHPCSPTSLHTTETTLYFTHDYSPGSYLTQRLRQSSHEKEAMKLIYWWSAFLFILSQDQYLSGQLVDSSVTAHLGFACISMMDHLYLAFRTFTQITSIFSTAQNTPTSLSTALKRPLVVFEATLDSNFFLNPPNLVSVLLLMVSAFILGASPSMTKTGLIPISVREETRKNRFLQRGEGWSRHWTDLISWVLIITTT